MKYLEAIRAHFPALERCQSGLPVAYFDGPGGTQVPRSVAEAITDYLLHHNANTHWAFATSSETDAMLKSSRRAVADFFEFQAGRNRVRQQHDHPDVSPGPRFGSRMGQG